MYSARKLTISVLLLVTVAATVPAQADPLPTGASNVVAAPQGAVVGYATPTVVTTAGTSVMLLNADVTGHDVTSRDLKTVVIKKRKMRKPLFQSDSLAAGASGEIKGTAALPVGEYDFYCSAHAGMSGKLIVK
jgi:plastocyanin